jgi:hypothetical protein
MSGILIFDPKHNKTILDLFIKRKEKEEREEIMKIILWDEDEDKTEETA